MPYDPNWPLAFENEAKLIERALGSNCVTIHHIGSTSIPGLKARPIIDRLPVVRNIQEVDKAAKAMESLGYEAKGGYGIAFRRYFQKNKNVRTHDVHVYQEGDSEINNLSFGFFQPLGCVKASGTQNHKQVHIFYNMNLTMQMLLEDSKTTFQ